MKGKGRELPIQRPTSPPQLLYFKISIWGERIDRLDLLGRNQIGASFRLYPLHAGPIPWLDRSRLQCLDLTAANETWTVELKNAPRGFIYFGSGFCSSKENKEFFMN